MKKFSIITPVYNGAKYIETCLKAVINANYNLDFIEHIVVDDGSTDNTKQICQNYASKHKHIKFYSKSNGNWGSVINYVKNNHLVKNDYVVVCDADDVILPDAFKIINQKNNNSDLCSGSFYLWDGDKKRRRVHTYYFAFKRNMTKKSEMQYYSPLLLPHCSYFKSEIFYKLNDLKEGVSYQDNILYLEVFRKSKSISYIPNFVSLYWQKREGNTMSEIKGKGLDLQVDNLKYYAANNTLEPFFYVLIGMKSLRKHLIKNNLKFNFVNPHLNLSGFPFYVRPILRLMYLIQIKKFIKH